MKTSRKVSLIFISSVLVLGAGALLAVDTVFAAPHQNWFVATTGSDSNDCLAAGTPCLTVQGAVNKATDGDTINVAAGTYSGNIIIPTGDNNLTIQGTGSVIFNLGSGYGVNLDNPPAVITGFTLSGFTFNSSSGTTYAFKAYKANGLTLTNDTFNGNGDGGGVDINTTSNVMLSNVSASGFAKNGFAVTSAYTTADDATPSGTITFNNITTTSNAWNGIAFYAAGNSGGLASMTGISFTGTNTISGNGTTGPTQGGIFIEGDTDANVALGHTPAETITTDGSTLDLTHVAFGSTNAPSDIVNYQTAPVNAVGATFGGVGGNAMTQSQITAENGKIYDHLDNVALGLVSFFTPDTQAPVVTVTPVAGSVIHGSETFTITVTDNKPLDPTKNKHVWVYLYNNAPPQASQGASVDLSSGSGTFTVDTTKLLDGTSTLDVGQVFDAAGNASGAGDNYFKNYVIDNTGPVVTVTPLAGSTLSDTETFTITVSDPHLDPSVLKHIWVYLYNNAPPQKSHGANVDLSSGTGTFTVDTTSLANGLSTLDVGKLYDALGNPSGVGDSYFKNYDIENVVPPTTVIVTIDKFLDGQMATAANASSTSFAMTSSWNATNIGSGTGSYSLGPTGFNSSNAYEAVTADMTSGASYSTQEQEPTECTVSYPFKLEGYTTGDSLAGAESATPSMTVPALTNITQNQYVIVWNDSCAPAAPTPSVTTDSANPVGALSATLNGTNGGINADQTSFWWGTTAPTGPITASATPYPGEFPSGWNSTGVNAGVNAGLPFSQNLTGLTPNTPYYFIAWVEVGGTWYPGSVGQFTTADGSVPSVTTNDASGLSDTGAQINGTVGAIDADQTSFWWGTGPGGPFTASATPYPSQFPAGWNSTGVNAGAGAGLTFDQMLSSLSPSTTYNFVAWIESGGVWYPGDVDSFMTAATPPPAPTAVADSATTNMNSETTIDVLANDTGATGIDPATLTQPTNGVVTIDGTEIDYTPNADYAGNDTFTYEAYNSAGTSTPATVTVTVKDTTTPVVSVTGANPAYVGVNGTYSDLGASVTDTPTDSIDIDVSLDGNATTSDFTLDTSTPGQHTVVYSATDGGGNTGTATRTIEVIPAPTATITTTSSNPTSDSPIPVTVTFSEPVTNFDETDVSLGNANGITNFQASSTNDLVYTFDVTPSGNGTVVVSIAPNKYADLAGDQNTTQAELDITYTAQTNNSNNNSGGGGGAPVARTGDINGDGRVNIKDFALLLAAWGAHGTNLAADLNHDGVVNALDLVILLANWTN